jgi:carboxypeptidase Taq
MTPAAPATPVAPYAELHQRWRRLNLLRDAAGLLDWDAAAMMPDGGAEARADQLATLRVLRHELLTHPAVGELLAAAADQPGLDRWQRANVREMRREWDHETAVPAALVEARSQAVSACEMRWRAARRDDDFASLLPTLAEVLSLTREVADAKASRLGLSAYDALLDEYEPDGRADEIDAVFAELEGFLPALLERALEHQASRPLEPLPTGPFPIAQQRSLAEALMRQLGFDFAHGRLDTSEHPFCGGVPDDVRITTRYDTQDFLRSLFSVLHETGHALYEQHLPREQRYQPVGQARGMSFHESQSLLVEMQACRSAEFFRYLAPLARATFGGEGPAWAAERLHRVVTRVERSLIRIQADELTYPLHVVLRYRLERAMISGDLALRDLPGAWRDGMRRLVGVVPTTDRDGCLQDIHWPGGSWGYFPTYTLGAMTAAQLFAAAVRAAPGIPEALSRGQAAPLVDWLRVKVHERASLLSTRDLLTEATGAPLDPAVFRAHLERRYLDGG